MNEYIYCGFWRRSIAVVLDRIFHTVFFCITFCMLYLVFLPFNAKLRELLLSNIAQIELVLSNITLIAPSNNLILGILLVVFTAPGFLFIIAYIPIFESSSMQATLGCYILGMKIINEDGTRISFLKSSVRVTVLLLINSTVILGIISIVCMICTDEKKFLHDIICGTRMVKR